MNIWVQINGNHLLNMASIESIDVECVKGRWAIRYQLLHPKADGPEGEIFHGPRECFPSEADARRRFAYLAGLLVSA